MLELRRRLLVAAESQTRRPERFAKKPRGRRPSLERTPPAMSLLGQYRTPQGGTVSSEWEDIHRALGNLPGKDEEPAPEPWKPAEDAPAGPSTAAEVDAADDGGDNDAAELARLRARRLDELKRRQRFGGVEQIAHDEFVAEVNQAGDGVGVVLLLFKKGHYGSSYMLVTLERLAAKFGDVKFLKIVSTECIPGYPDRNLPTLLVYKDDDMLAQWVGTKMFGGAQYSADDVEWELAQLGVLTTELAKNPHAEPHR